MSETPPDPDLNTVPNWYRDIFPAGEHDGYYQKFGNHAACFIDRGAHQLVVTFDNLAEAGGRHLAREPWAGKFCADNGWSHLGIFAQGPTWFRDQRLIHWMEQQRDAGFFDGFDRVAFCGTSMGGFGALTFCDLSPNATVIAFSPQTTLAADLVPWEKRFNKGRRQDWSLAYSDAAEHTASAAQVFVVYDPFLNLDVHHIDRLHGSNIIPLHGFGLGHRSALVLRRMDRLKPVMQQAINGTLTPALFYQMIRNRKDIYMYRANMESYLEARNRPELQIFFRAAFRRRRKSRAAT